MKFTFEGEFWHCHFAGIKLGASNQMLQHVAGQIGVRKRENVKSLIFYSTYCINCNELATKFIHLVGFGTFQKCSIGTLKNN